MVDRPGIVIVGCTVYGGMGAYEYELELLDDQTTGAAAASADREKALPPPAASAQRWNSLELAHGTYTLDDCINDIGEVKFDHPVAVKPHVKYALRLRNHGGRTSNGDGGVAAVKGPDGTTFTFSSCSLSFNGTNPMRGQLPQILYFSSPMESDSHSSSQSVTEVYARRTALSMTSTVVKTATALFVTARDADDEASCNDVLDSAPVITKLLPHIFANVCGLAKSDPRCAVHILGLIQDMLPSVASLNNLFVANAGAKEEAAPTRDVMATPHHAWVESDHPYKSASVNHYKVTFSSSVRWMSVEFDPRSCTAQVEDVLQLYIRSPSGGTSKLPSVGQSVGARESSKSLVSSTHADLSGQQQQQQQVQQMYTPVMKGFSGPPSAWPQQAIVLPGNEILFSLETASDYVKDEKVRLLLLPLRQLLTI
jgi:E3 ubiquitin-protein ligase MYCBP2